MTVQIETRESVDNLEAICNVEGVDGVFVGPSDLAASFGHMGNPSAPAVQEAIQHVVNTARNLGKAAGTRLFSRPSITFAPMIIRASAVLAPRCGAAKKWANGKRSISAAGKTGTSINHIDGTKRDAFIYGRKLPFFLIILPKPPCCCRFPAFPNRTRRRFQACPVPTQSGFQWSAAALYRHRSGRSELPANRRSIDPTPC